MVSLIFMPGVLKCYCGCRKAVSLECGVSLVSEVYPKSRDLEPAESKVELSQIGLASFHSIFNT